VIVALEAVFALYFLAHHYMTAGYDGFEHFTGAYFILNGNVMYGETPLWNPYFTQGAFTLGYNFVPWSGFAQNAFAVFAVFLKPLSYYWVHYAQFFVEELVLLAGCWLWSGYFCRYNLSRAFFSFTAVGTAIWFLQPYGNFRIYYCLPLIFFLMHLAFDRRRLFYFALALNLTFLSVFGGVAYFLPLFSFLIVLYTAGLFLGDISGVARGFKFEPKDLFASFVVLALTGFCFYQIFFPGTDQAVIYKPGRGFDGATQIGNYLTSYVDSLQPFRWGEMALGFSPDFHTTRYAGILAVPLVFCSLWNIKKENAHLFLIPVILFLVSAGTFVAFLLWKFWPGMHYFRYLATIAPIIKIFLCLLAALGLDALIGSSISDTPRISVWKFLYLCLFVLFLMAAWNFTLVHGGLVSYLRSYMYDPCEGMYFLRIFRPWIEPRLVTTITLIVLYIVFFSWTVIRGKKAVPFVLLLLVLCHIFDVYSYKVSEVSTRSFRVPEGFLKVARFEKIPFQKRRVERLDFSRPRAEILHYLPITLVLYSSSFNIFLWQDEPGGSFYVYDWLRPLDKVMRAYWKQDIADTTKTPAGLDVRLRRLTFPLAAPSARKMAGVDEDKIQFFSDIYPVPNEKMEAEMISSSAYKGDVPLVIGGAGQPNYDLSRDARLRLPYEVTSFQPNEIVVKVNSPVEKAFLFYSDVWHPFWRATVNGRSVEILRANLAYKLVSLNKGMNEVRLFIYAPLQKVAVDLVHWFSLFWIVAILAFFFFHGFRVNGHREPAADKKG
jgi:hypothetical protein